VIAVTGRNTTIVQALADVVSEDIVRIDGDWSAFDAEFSVPEAGRYVLAAGVLTGKRIQEQSADDILRCIAVNLVNVIRLCEHILDTNPKARICIVGSESGFRGSFDQTYGVSKAAVHAYVQSRKVKPGQQLVAVAPHVILDSGMTRARHDYEALVADAGRKFVTPRAVAEAIHFLLWSEGPWINNSVLRMAG
jgi:NAD(P)-dependent dehydrogenase (short-subunit alcohol dehydrogenase family)